MNTLISCHRMKNVIPTPIWSLHSTRSLSHSHKLPRHSSPFSATVTPSLRTERKRQRKTSMRNPKRRLTRRMEHLYRYVCNTENGAPVQVCVQHREWSTYTGMCTAQRIEHLYRYVYNTENGAPVQVWVHQRIVHLYRYVLVLGDRLILSCRTLYR